MGIMSAESKQAKMVKKRCEKLKNSFQQLEGEFRNIFENFFFEEDLYSDDEMTENILEPPSNQESKKTWLHRTFNFLFELIMVLVYAFLPLPILFNYVNIQNLSENDFLGIIGALVIFVCFFAFQAELYYCFSNLIKLGTFLFILILSYNSVYQPYQYGWSDYKNHWQEAKKKIIPTQLKNKSVPDYYFLPQT